MARSTTSKILIPGGEVVTNNGFSAGGGFPEGVAHVPANFERYAENKLLLCNWEVRRAYISRQFCKEFQSGNKPPNYQELRTSEHSNINLCQ